MNIEQVFFCNKGHSVRVRFNNIIRSIVTNLKTQFWVEKTFSNVLGQIYV